MTGFWEAILEEREAHEEQASEILEETNSRLCNVTDACLFDCIAITAPNPRAAAAYLDELMNRLDGSGNKEILIIAVSDPEGVRIGSGGGTLNAVLEVDEALRAASVRGVDGDSHGGGLTSSRVLLVHSGGDSQRSPTQCVCGKAWSALNSCGNDHSKAAVSGGVGGGCNTPMDLLLDHLLRLFSSGGQLPAGSLVVTACDVMLLIPTQVAASADWSAWASGDDEGRSEGSVAGLAIAADAAKYAPNHGVYCLADQGEVKSGAGGSEKCGVMGVRRYLQKPSYQAAETAGAFLPTDGLDDSDKQQKHEDQHAAEGTIPEVAIDTGVVVFSGTATAALVRLATSEAFKGCTTRGVADGADALRLELYSDLLLALRTEESAGGEGTGGMERYLSACGPALGPDNPLTKARLEVWEALSCLPLGAMLLRGATFVHLGTTPELLDMMTLRLKGFVEPYGLTARAACVVGRMCSVSDDPPAIIVNSKLQGAGVVAGGSVVEHCHLEGDGWEVGASCLVSGVRSVPADHRLRVRGGMCIQQIDLGCEDDGVGQENDEEQSDAEMVQGETDGDEDGTEQEQGESEGEQNNDDDDEDDDGDDDDDDRDEQEEPQNTFVVSLFAVHDDIKAHYSKPTATFCGSTWPQFLRYTGATVEDIWPDVPDAARTLWSAKLFPVHSCKNTGGPQQSTGNDNSEDSNGDHSNPAARILWMQNVRDTGTTSTTAASLPLPIPPPPNGDSDAEIATPGVVKSWLAAERLSFKDILRRAEPSAEFEWRRRLEEGMGKEDAAESTGDIPEAGCRAGFQWDAVALVTGSMEELRGAQLRLPFVTGEARTALCVPPPRPSSASTMTPTIPDEEGMGGDGPLVLNALLVVAERFSALKKAKFGSETSAVALRGMRVLLCLGDGESKTRTGERFVVLTGVTERAKDGVWVLQRDGGLFRIGDDPLAALLNLCLSDPIYQRLTYLGVDNGLHNLETPPTPTDGNAHCPLAYVTAAATAAHTSPPARHEHENGCVNTSAAGAGASTGVRSTPVHQVVGAELSNIKEVCGILGSVRELDERAAQEECTVAGAAQALARIACRLFDLADILGGGGHRSGPGEHPDWQAYMRGLDTLRASPRPSSSTSSLPWTGWAPPAALPTAVDGLKRLRNAWVGIADDSSMAAFGDVGLPDPHLVVRCARHYERAAAILVSAAVATASMFVEPPPVAWLIGTKHIPNYQATEEKQPQQQHQHQLQEKQVLPVGASVTSQAAARIDLAGGWTDTPPISYEAGGSVVNAAVTVSGERPVDARCERIKERRVELVCVGREGVPEVTIVCTKLADFADFCVPQAPAALLKAAIICAGIVTLPFAAVTETTCATAAGTASLEEQLARVFGNGGIRVTSCSRLPQGSGMGTSSILAGTVLNSVCVAAGRAMSKTSLVHAVLHVEQLMTAGGGHQDQVGGLLGGVKITRSAATLPLEVRPESISLDPAFEHALNERLLLVFSGKQRLARDLLQGVVRGWHDRSSATVATVKGLVQNAEEAAQACRGHGDIKKLGRCLSIYWEQKERMAPGAEPPQLKNLLDRLRPLSYGLSVCGAGGGGFVVCITKSPGDEGMVQVTNALATGPLGPSHKVSNYTVHRGRLDPVGMEMSIDLPTPA